MIKSKLFNCINANYRKLALPLLVIGVSVASFNCFANIKTTKTMWNNIPTTVNMHYKGMEVQMDTTYTEIDLDDPSKITWHAFRTPREHPVMMAVFDRNTHTNIIGSCQPNYDPGKPPFCARFSECDNFQAIRSGAKDVYIDLFLTDPEHGYCSIRWK